jgi:hypothetical protein
MTLIEELHALRALLEDPARWTQRAFARSGRDGSPCYPSSEEAAQWCLVGATDIMPNPVSVRRALFAALERRVPLMTVNDAEGHDAVLALIDAAIEREAALAGRSLTRA